MIGILGGMGTQAGLDFCNKLAMLNRGKIDQEYPLFILYNKSNIPGRPESIGVQTRNFSASFIFPILTCLIVLLTDLVCKLCEGLTNSYSFLNSFS